MATAISDSPAHRSRSFQQIVDAFLTADGLPFANIISAERIRRIFQKHDCLFGLYGVSTTAITVWSFLSQVLRDGKEASCQAAVARVVSYCEQLGLIAPTADTGDYCRARAKLSVAALRELSGEVAEELEQAAETNWLWKGRYHAKLVDGFTVFTSSQITGHHARHSAESGGVPAPEGAAAGNWSPHRPRDSHPLVGDRLRVECGHRPLSGEGDRRVGTAAFDARLVARG